MKYLSSFILALLLSAGGNMVWAADDHPMTGPSAGAPGGFTDDYIKAMNNMHGPMMSGIMDPDPDLAFVKGMIPHHQGAVEMAEIQLKYGKDPELHKLARDIIAAQDREIDYMQKWLKAKENK